ncbi:hypothetical protein QJS66_08420 [Kocuria rhizophila]|nr:hypothetical protein QJS66_08420 [Kocuria rhizophila]
MTAPVAAAENGSTGSAHAAAEQRRRSARELLCATLDAIVRGLPGPRGQRILPLLGDPGLVPAALREDALRQTPSCCACSPAPSGLLERDGTDRRARPVPQGRRSPSSSSYARSSRERVPSQPRWTPTRRRGRAARRAGGRLLHLCARPGPGAAAGDMPSPSAADWGEVRRLHGNPRRERAARALGDNAWRARRTPPGRQGGHRLTGMMVTGSRGGGGAARPAAVAGDGGRRRRRFLSGSGAGPRAGDARADLARRRRRPHEGALEDRASRGGATVRPVPRRGGHHVVRRSCGSRRDGPALPAGRRVLETAELDDTLAAAGATGRAGRFDERRRVQRRHVRRWLSELSGPRWAGARAGMVAAVTAAATGVVLKAPTAAGGMVSAVLAGRSRRSCCCRWRTPPGAVARAAGGRGRRRVLDALVLESVWRRCRRAAGRRRRVAVWRCRVGRCELPVRSVEELRQL